MLIRLDYINENCKLTPFSLEVLPRLTIELKETLCLCRLKQSLHKLVEATAQVRRQLLP